MFPEHLEISFKNLLKINAECRKKRQIEERMNTMLTHFIAPNFMHCMPLLISEKKSTKEFKLDKKLAFHYSTSISCYIIHPSANILNELDFFPVC